MGIEFSRSYKTSDGLCHSTLHEAQASELALLFVTSDSGTELSPELAAAIVLKNSVKILSILTTTEKSRPSARKANGAVRKPRKPKATATPEIDAKVAA